MNVGWIFWMLTAESSFHFRILQFQRKMHCFPKTCFWISLALDMLCPTAFVMGAINGSCEADWCLCWRLCMGRCNFQKGLLDASHQFADEGEQHWRHPKYPVTWHWYIPKCLHQQSKVRHVDNGKICCLAHISHPQRLLRFFKKRKIPEENTDKVSPYPSLHEST